jgi:hypothetical protein
LDEGRLGGQGEQRAEDVHDERKPRHDKRVSKEPFTAPIRTEKAASPGAPPCGVPTSAIRRGAKGIHRQRRTQISQAARQHAPSVVSEVGAHPVDTNSSGP